MWLRECQYTMTDDDDVGNKEKKSKQTWGDHDDALAKQALSAERGYQGRNRFAARRGCYSTHEVDWNELG